jgi:hypothetical protein
MAIQASAAHLHWNYFLALEHDLEAVSRYIEFSPANFSVYSIELAHLLFAAASEVDVVAKLVCEQVRPEAPRHNINHYKDILVSELPHLTADEVLVPRYGLTLTPWEAWSGESHPLWWRGYNNVKHERDRYFNEATLKNSLNALAALMLLTIHFYQRSLAPSEMALLPIKKTMNLLQPDSSLLRLREENYFATVIA